MGESVELIGAQVFFAAVPATIGLIHLFLFIFEPRRRRNLYFAIIAVTIGVLAWIDFEEMQHGSGELVETVPMIVIPILLLSISRFIYALFYDERPATWNWIVGAVVVYFAVLVVDRGAGAKLGMIITLAVIGESLRVILVRYRPSRSDVLLPTLGIAAFALCAMGDLLLDLGVVDDTILGTSNPYLIGALLMLLAMSVHLARDFARTGRGLEAQLARVIEQEQLIRDEEVRRRVAEAENARRGDELAEARQLQLAMLPDELPEVEGLDIAASMQTASEVGGDYYDFHHDGTGLTILLGDAVGHGARAGSLVAATKSMFHLVDPADVRLILERMDDAIRRMRLKRIHMALTAVRIEGSRVAVATAGMPPVLLRRARTAAVEELVTPRVPLGSMPMPFEVRSAELGEGDLLVMMSDGLPELHRDGAEIGYDGLTHMLRDVPASVTARQTIDRLLESTRGATLTDDLTLVVVKLCGPSSAVH